MKAWNVYCSGQKIDTVYYDSDDAEDVKKSLIHHDTLCNGKGKYRPYPENIVVKLDKKSCLNTNNNIKIKG